MSADPKPSYLAHWGIEVPLFNPSALFVPESHERPLAYVRFLLSMPGQVIALAGAAGVGKTRYLKELYGITYGGAVDALFVTPLDQTSGALVAAIHRYLAGSPDTRTASLARQLTRLGEEGRRLAVFIDFPLEEPHPDLATLLTVQRLHFWQFTLVCAGSTGIEPYSWDIVPFSAAETSAYCQHCVACAGLSEDPFSDEARDELHQATGGEVRAINRLGELTLGLAASRGLTEIDRGLVAEVRKMLR